MCGDIALNYNKPLSMRLVSKTDVVTDETRHITGYLAGTENGS